MPPVSFAPRRKALVAALLVAACAHPVLALAAVPSFDEVRRDFRSSDTAVLDRNGELLQRVRTDATVRRGQWTALADVSPALRTAMVLSEDKRFYEHSGIDWRAVSSAAWGNLWNTRTRGASTITMQLSGLLDDDLRRTGGGRSFTQKIGQTVAAAQLERNWRKDQILEAYLNTVPFRGEIVGIDALSRTLFSKAPSGLDAREASVAAALVRAPNAKPAVVAQRACEVLRAMEPERKADCEALDMFTSAAVQRRAFDANEGIAPHAARRVLREMRDANAGAAPTPALPQRGREQGGKTQGWYFQAPFSILTITRARWSRPRWSVGVRLNTPCAPDTSLVCSSASRRAARNSGVPGWAFLSATGTAAVISRPASQACAPKVDTEPLP